MEKVLVSWSSGKDSALSLYEIQRSGEYEIASLLTTVTENYDRVSLHGVPADFVRQQARSIGLPLREVLIPSPCTNEQYDEIMRRNLAEIKEQEGIRRVVFGDIFLEWIKDYRANNLAQVGMSSILPLWGRDTAELSRSFVELGFRALATCVDTRVLNKEFAGRVIDGDFLAALPAGVDPCGENGEFHSFVFAGPIFKEKITCAPGETVMRDSFCFCDVIRPEGVS